MENKKSLVALALVALVGIVGATFAYFTSSATLTNEFETGTYSTSVTEEFVSPDNWTPGTTTPKKVNVTNNGSVEVAVRAKYIEKWTAKNGTVLSGTRNGERVAQFTTGSDWELATDGYYYYKGTLTSGQTSSDFISSVTFNPNFILEEGTDIECTSTKVDGKTISSCTSLTSGYAGATYSLDITIETIQSDRKWDYYRLYKIGEEIVIENEKFNVISDNGDTVTMLAQYTLGTNYRQSQIANPIDFSNNNGWKYTLGPNEIDIQEYDGNAKTYVNNYVTYLKAETGDMSLTGTLITLEQLKKIGCTITDDYLPQTGVTCVNSIYIEWLANGQKWWTRSVPTNVQNGVFVVKENGEFSLSVFNSGASGNGIRPIITISKSAI